MQPEYLATLFGKSKVKNSKTQEKQNSRKTKLKKNKI
jgi:hypothetical protein